MATLETLVKQQTTQAGYISHMWTNMQKLGQAKIDQHEIKSRLTRLDNYWEQFQERHFELIALEGFEASAYNKSDVFTTTEESYFSVRAQFLTALSKKQTPERRMNRKLFSGDQLAWEDFRDLFSSLVHNVPDIPAVQKLQHLRSCLSGEAAAVVAKAPVTDAAYEGAWSDLVARYDNRRILLFSYMRNLLSCPGLSKASPAELKRLLGVVTQSIRAFASLERPVDKWDDWFVHLLVTKTDSQTRLQWETSLGNSRNFPSFQQLRDWMENRIRALEVANPDVSPTQAASASGSRAIKPARVSANATSTFKPKPNGKCPLCKENHLLSYYAKYKGLTVANQGELAKKFNLCLSCLRTGHRVDACAATGRCLVCSGKHHTSLHGFTFQHVANPESLEGGEIGTVTSSSTATTSVAALAAPTAPTVLLKTVMVTLLSDSGRTIKVRALLDSGAQSTFVTEWVAQQLHARRRRVNVTVLGLQEAHMGVVSSSCRLTVSSPHKPSLRLPTEALVLRSLTSLLPPERVRTTSWPHLSGLELADPAYDVPAPVGAVLSSDVYDLVMEPALRHGPPGSPSAQLTAFGWVLSGLAPVDRGMTTAHRISVNFARTNEDLSRAVQRLWELEEVSSKSPLTPDEI
ncbi:uncharacterized protein LOC105206883 [Solenopsis invicta]|uniref:uncharacterized protein LOC105206883 n=1 Tax=Solenopsis invicta TaxID=13686 RepID=UPI00193E217D|nr:uncharacterized protein LOC105206883 [Solenopsis invicta]